MSICMDSGVLNDSGLVWELSKDNSRNDTFLVLKHSGYFMNVWKGLLQPLSLFLLTSHKLKWGAGIHCASAEMAIIGTALWALHPALWSQDDLCRTGGLSDWLAGLEGPPLPHWLGHMELRVLWTAVSATLILTVCVLSMCVCVWRELSLVVLYWSSQWHVLP